MDAEKPWDDDPLLRRVAAARPPVPEEELSPDSPTARAIAERVLAGPPPAPDRRPRGRWARPQWVLPRVGLALAPVAAVIVLLLAGTFSGPGSSGTESAAAAVIRATSDALAVTPGSIFVEAQTYVSGPTVHGHPYTIRSVLETPAHGPQSYLVSSDDPSALGTGPPHLSAYSYTGGSEQFYVPSTNTIYTSSIWGPYIHPGPRPGTYVYRNGPGAVFTATRPIPVTARQRRLLLSGQYCIRTTGKLVDGKVQISGPKILPPLRAPAENAQTLKAELANHALHLVGRTTVDGRDAIELAGKTTDATAPELHLYFDPTTHLPFEEVDSVGTRRQQTIHISLQKLPITAASERLLSLRALHPSARVDRSERDYQREDHGVQFFTQ